MPPKAKPILGLMLYGVAGIALWMCIRWFRMSAGCPPTGDCYNAGWQDWAWLQHALVAWWVLLPIIVLRVARRLLRSQPA